MRGLGRRFGPAGEYAAHDEGRGTTPVDVEVDGTAILGSARIPAEADGTAAVHGASGKTEEEDRKKSDATSASPAPCRSERGAEVTTVASEG